VEAVAAMPESLEAAEAAPLLCPGITTFNALRHSGALPGDLVAVQGIDGLGHLGIQFAQKFGYKVAAIGRGWRRPFPPRSSGRASTSTAPQRTPGGAEKARRRTPDPGDIWEGTRRRERVGTVESWSQ
jgi:hypothetical protein